MAPEEVNALRHDMQKGFADVRKEIKDLSDKMISKELFAVYADVIKPSCDKRMVKLEDQMVTRRLFEVKVYTVAALTAFVISVAVKFIR